MAVIIAIATVLLVSGSDGRKYQKHMEAAQQYLDELQYEQAIAEYELAIEIEPNNASAYKKLAELYVEIEDYESAIAVLNQGIEQTDSRRLVNYLEKVQVNWEENQTQATSAQAKQEAQESSQKPAGEDGPREETIYEDGGRYVINEYDWGGNLVKETWYDVDGTIGYTIYEYDEDGKLVKETYYDE